MYSCAPMCLPILSKRYLCICSQQRDWCTLDGHNSALRVDSKGPGVLRLV